MTDDVFEDLVNLYLDKEINPAQLQILRDELERNPPRHTIFGSYCRMHQATHFAALSACPVIPRLESSGRSGGWNAALFSINRKVWAAAMMVVLLTTFAAVYFNGPFGSARIVAKSNTLERIDTFIQTTPQPSQFPLEYFRSLKARSETDNWSSYARELRHARSGNGNDYYPQISSPHIWLGDNPRISHDQSIPEGFNFEYSGFEFKR